MSERGGNTETECTRRTGEREMGAVVVQLCAPSVFFSSLVLITLILLYSYEDVYKKQNENNVNHQQVYRRQGYFIAVFRY